MEPDMTTEETTEVLLRAENLALAAVKDRKRLGEYLEAIARVKEVERRQRLINIARKTPQTQVEKLIVHMTTIGPISLREALMEYGVQSLTRRISDIREAGFDVVAYPKRNPVTGQEYTKYGLLGEKT